MAPSLVEFETDRMQQLTVGDCMSADVVIVPESSSMHAAASILADHCITGAPVVDDAGRCVGVITVTDFLTFEIARTGDVVAAHGRNCNGSATQLPWNAVRKFMSTAVQTVERRTSLLRASEIMCAEHIHRLFVLNERGAPIGVISTTDVAAALIKATKEQNELRAARDLKKYESFQQYCDYCTD
jgi:CBS-domain-containing membrane protein